MQRHDAGWLWRAATACTLFARLPAAPVHSQGLQVSSGMPYLAAYLYVRPSQLHNQGMWAAMSAAPPHNPLSSGANGLAIGALSLLHFL